MAAFSTGHRWGQVKQGTNWMSGAPAHGFPLVSTPYARAPGSVSSSFDYMQILGAQKATSGDVAVKRRIQDQNARPTGNNRPKSGRQAKAAPQSRPVLALTAFEAVLNSRQVMNVETMVDHTPHGVTITSETQDRYDRVLGKGETQGRVLGMKINTASWDERVKAREGSMDQSKQLQLEKALDERHERLQAEGVSEGPGSSFGSCDLLNWSKPKKWWTQSVGDRNENKRCPKPWLPRKKPWQPAAHKQDLSWGRRVELARRNSKVGMMEKQAAFSKAKSKARPRTACCVGSPSTSPSGPRRPTTAGAKLVIWQQDASSPHGSKMYSPGSSLGPSPSAETTPGNDGWIRDRDSGPECLVSIISPQPTSQDRMLDDGSNVDLNQSLNTTLNSLNTTRMIPSAMTISTRRVARHEQLVVQNPVDDESDVYHEHEQLDDAFAVTCNDAPTLAGDEENDFCGELRDPHTPHFYSGNEIAVSPIETEFVTAKGFSGLRRMSLIGPSGMFVINEEAPTIEYRAQVAHLKPASLLQAPRCVSPSGRGSAPSV